MGKINKILSGVAGEYLVAGELSRRGYIASITLRNTKGVDILASNGDATKSVAIQVKTNQGTVKSWQLTKKDEDNYADKFFYVLVSLNNGDAPDFHVIPSKTLASYIKKNHQKWLDTPGRKGQKHRDTDMRKFTDKEGKYLNKWKSLDLD